MKKIFHSILFLMVLFVFGQNIQAQDTRTLDTKVVDILALMPANDLEFRNKLAEELVQLGDEGFQNLADRMTPSGVDDNTAVVFALNGLARYASTPGKEAQRAFAEKNFIVAMEVSPNAEVKQFYMRQLDLVGQQAAVKAVMPYLTQEELSEPAVFLLTSISGDLAISELMEALPKVNEKMQIPIVKALGELRVKAANPRVLKLIETKNINLKTVSLAALASIGSEESYKPLLAAAKSANFTYEATQSAEAFVVYANRLGENGSMKLCDKACNEIIKLKLATSQLHLKSSALAVYTQFFEQKAQPVLLKEFDNTDKAYRFSVLNLVSGSKSASVESWISKATKSQAEQNAEIITMLGNKMDASAAKYVKTQLANPSEEVGKAAIVAYSKLKGKEAVPELTELLAKGIYPKHAADNLLVFVDEKHLDQIAALLQSAPDASKIEIIRIIGAKSGKRFFEPVFKSTNSTNPEIKSASIAALKNISSANDVEKLIGLLYSTDNAVMIKDIQDALTTAALAIDDTNLQADLLLEKLASGPKRELILAILPRIGGSKALTAVSGYLNSTDQTEREAAFIALVNWKDYAAAEKLLEVYKTSEGEKKAGALKGFVNQIGNSPLTDEEKSIELGRILAVATSTSDKSMVIKSMAKVKTLATFITVSNYIDNKELMSDAANAAMEIALPTGAQKGLSGKLVREVLTNILALNGFSGTESDYNKVKTTKYLATMPADAEAGNSLTKAEQAEGFFALFDGTNLDYWIGNKTDYLVQDGMITLRPKQGGHGNLYTAKEYSNFIFRFEFQLKPGANNGLGIHAPLDGDAAYVGKELQILDDSAPIYAKLQPYQYHGSVYGTIPAKRGSLKPVGEWNYQEVIVKGDDIKITLNGNVIVDGNMAEASKNGTPDHKEHPGLLRHTGHIGFLGHGAELQFRNIRIKELTK